MRKPGDIVHVHNDFREAPLYALKETEQNLMWTLLYEVKDKGLDELNKHGRVDISIPVKDIVEKSRYNKRLKNLGEDFDSIADTITNYKIPITDGKYRGKVVPFPIVKMSNDGTEVVVTVLREFAYIVDYVLCQANFSKLSLSEVNGLNGKYAKIAYYHMSTYADIGVWCIKFAELVKVLGIPKTYKPRDVRRQIIAPILNGCGKHFNNMKYYEKSGPKRSIDEIMFVFEPKVVKDIIKQEIKRNSQLQRLQNEAWKDKTDEVISAFGINVGDSRGNRFDCPF